MQALFTPTAVLAVRRLLAAAVLALAAAAPAQAAPRCLTDCTQRIGIVSAFGAEADILVAQTQGRRTHTVNGNRFTTGTLRGNRVVIVLSGVSMVNATMVTQLMLSHFRIERLVMSGIAGGLNPDLHVGDVTVPERWVMASETYWHQDNSTPGPCGKPADVSCFGLKLALGADGQPIPPLALPGPQGPLPTGMFMRETYLLNARNAPKGEFRFAYPVDAQMLAVARTLQPNLARCAGTPQQCVKQQPRLVVGGTGVTGSLFLANAAYRKYLFEHLQGNTFEMETAALAHVAAANGVPYIAFRSLSDLAGAEGFDADAVALFTSGLAEANEAAVTLSFLEAWKARRAPKGARP